MTTDNCIKDMKMHMNFFLSSYVLQKYEVINSRSEKTLQIAISTWQIQKIGLDYFNFRKIHSATTVDFSMQARL